VAEMVNDNIIFASRIGKKTISQDYFCIEVHRNQLLLVVSDGMGGHPDGHEASRILSNELIECYKQYQDFQETIRLGIPKALRKMEAINSKMSTTFVFAVISEKKSGLELKYTWIGDSRIYLRKKKLSKNKLLIRIDQSREKYTYLCTHDDSLVWNQQYISQKNLDDITAHPRKSALLLAITPLLSEQELVANALDRINRLQVKEGDRLLLCTDGLWELYDRQIELAMDMRKGEFKMTERIDEKISQGIYYDDSTYIYIKIKADLLQNDNLACSSEKSW
jgi:serine/threonine protein phosphatase PrpC